MKKVIINADDFGMTTGVNLGIIKAIKEGIVTSTTLMINMPKAKEAINLAKENDLYCVGLHLNLTKGRPVSNNKDVNELIDENGNFKNLRDIEITETIKQQIYLELKNQIDLFVRLYQMPTHLDSHHHIHEKEVINNIVINLASAYNLPMRSSKKIDNIKTPDYFIASFYDKNVSYNTIQEILLSLNDGITEVMTHPGYFDSELETVSIYNQKRQDELKILTCKQFKNIIKEQNIKLISYNDL